MAKPMLIIDTLDGSKYYKTLHKMDEKLILNHTLVVISNAKKDDFISVDGNILVRYNHISTITIGENVEE